MEVLKEIMNGKIPNAPIAQLLGIEIIEIDTNRAVVTMEVSEKHHNPMGTVHGGVMCDIADIAMGYAMATTLVGDELFTTIEIKLNFLKPVWKSKLRAVGEIIKRGSSTALLECYIYDEKDSIVAHATSTCMILKDNAGVKRIKENKNLTETNQ